MQHAAVEPRNSWRAVSLLVILAFVFRAASPLLLPNIANADEVYQTVEQAYRLLTGRGLVPWEYYYGIRSWIFPGLLAVIIKAGWTLGLGAMGTYTFMRLVMVAMSLPTVVCAYFWGQRSGLPGAALLAGGLVAIWPDLAYFSSHPLSEVVATALFAPGVFLADAARGRNLGSGRVFLAALVLSSASTFRVQIGPAALLAWAWMIWPAWRARALPAILGGLVPVLASGAVDWITWGRPWQSIWLYAIVNWGYGAASTFGTSPWFAYIAKFDVMWGGATPFIALAALIGAPRARLVAATALVVLIAHTLIGHKEYRFVFPAIPLIITLAGIGTARLILILVQGLRAESLGRWRGASGRVTAVACVIWATAIGSLYLSREFIELFRHHTGVLQASADVARKGDLCGLGIWNVNWLYLAGESSIGRAVPIFYPDNEAEFADRAPGFNVVLYQRERTQKEPALPNADWKTESCHPMEAKLPPLLAHDEHDYEICLAERAGTCVAEPPLKPPMFLPKELKGAPFPWIEKPLPDEPPRIAGAAGAAPATQP